MAEIENCSSSQSETTSSYSSSQLQKPKVKTKGIAFKRRNPKLTVRRNRGSSSNVAAIGFPLGMSFAAVMAQVNFISFLYFSNYSIFLSCFKAKLFFFASMKKNLLFFLIY
jgi:hypothetical protein